MTKIRRAQIGKAHGIDITVKSAKGPAKFFAPTWEMVSNFKNGAMSWETYTELYEARLSRAPASAWAWLGGFGSEVTVLCYCRDGWKCHTYLLAAYAAKHFPNLFEDGTGGYR